MSRLLDIAKRLEENAANYTAPQMLRKLDENYTLRRYGVKREKKQVLDENGEPIRNAYFPHLAITATCYARTWKMLKDAEALWGGDDASLGRVWEERLLLACEHIVRWLKREIDDAEMQRQIQRLINPLPKRDYIRNLNKGNEETKEGETK